MLAKTQGKVQTTFVAEQRPPPRQCTTFETIDLSLRNGVGFIWCFYARPLISNARCGRGSLVLGQSGHIFTAMTLARRSRPSHKAVSPTLSSTEIEPLPQGSIRNHLPWPARLWHMCITSLFYGVLSRFMELPRLRTALMDIRVQRLKQK